MEFDKLEVGLIAVAGSILVATLTHFYTKSLERLKQNENLKVEAYVDFLKAVASLTGTGGEITDKEKIAELYSQILDAKIRISIYGSISTIKKLSNFCVNGNETYTNEGRGRLFEVIQSMRNDFQKTGIDMEDIYKILYLQPPPAGVK